MDSILYFLFLAGMFALMMRFGCGAHVLGHRSHHRGGAGDRPATPPLNVIDPVCGMTVETAKAKTSVHAGRTYYFCSSECREKFETSPYTYLDTSKNSPSVKEAPHAPHH